MYYVYEKDSDEGMYVRLALVVKKINTFIHIFICAQIFNTRAHAHWANEERSITQTCTERISGDCSNMSYLPEFSGCMCGENYDIIKNYLL